MENLSTHQIVTLPVDHYRVTQYRIGVWQLDLPCQPFCFFLYYSILKGVSKRNGGKLPFISRLKLEFKELKIVDKDIRENTTIITIIEGAKIMIAILILILSYITLGISRIIRDFNQPILNQPAYVRHPTMLRILIAFIFAPSFWWTEIRHPLPKSIKEKLKKSRDLERKFMIKR